MPVTHVERFTLGAGIELLDWTWCGHTLVASSGSGGAYTIQILTLAHGELNPKTGSIGMEGRLPIAIDRQRFAYFEREKRITLASLSDADRTTSLDLGDIGHIGRIQCAAGALWFHAVQDYEQPATPRMFAVTMAPLQLIELGSGYYPTTHDGQRLFYVDQERGFELRSLAMKNGRRSSDKSGLISAGKIFATQAIPGTDLLVCQRGENWPSIELLDDNGKLLRCLSGSGRSGLWPCVSPSGKYVAYTHHEAGDSRAKVVEVVSVDGQLVYQALIGSHPITAAYRWSPTEDKLAVVVAQTVDTKVLNIVSF